MVDSETLYRDLLKAVALGNVDDIARLNDERLSRERDTAERARFRTLASALFCIALEQRFGEDTSLDAVKRFVDEMRYDYRNAQPPIKPFVTEGLIRAVLGEEHLLDEISPEEQLESQFPVIRKITMQSSDMTERIDAYLADMVALADHWTSQE